MSQTSTLTITLPSRTSPSRSSPSLPENACPSPSHLCSFATGTEPFPDYFELPGPFMPLPIGADAGSVAGGRNAGENNAGKVGLWQRIVSPLLFVAFLVSWAMLDWKNRGREKEGGHRGWETTTVTASKSQVGTQNSEGWIWQVGKRRLAKTEMSSALALRGKVAMALVMGMGVVLMAAVLGGGWMMKEMRGRLEGVWS